MRAAAATAIAFLACHPIGAKGDECMWGPYREALLQAGALRVLLEAALAPTEDDNCRKVIEKAAAVGVMYLCTVVRTLTLFHFTILTTFSIPLCLSVDCKSVLDHAKGHSHACTTREHR